MAYKLIRVIVFAVYHAKHALADFRDGTQLGKAMSKAFAPGRQMPRLSGSIPKHPAAAGAPENAEVVVGSRFPVHEASSRNQFGYILHMEETLKESNEELRETYQHLRYHMHPMPQADATVAQSGFGFGSLMGLMASAGLVASIGIAIFRMYFVHGQQVLDSTVDSQISLPQRSGPSGASGGSEFASVGYFNTFGFSKQECWGQSNVAPVGVLRHAEIMHGRVACKILANKAPFQPAAMVVDPVDPAPSNQWYWTLDEMSQEYALWDDLDSKEVEISDGKDDTREPFKAYMTQLRHREGRPRLNYGLLMLPDASGWRDAYTRQVADYLAIGGECVVLVPDLLREVEPRDSTDYTAGPGARSHAREDRDVVECIVSLRVDQHIEGKIAVIGFGLGGGQAARANSQLAEFAGAALICPRLYSLDDLAAARAPTLVLFDGDARGLEQAQAAMLSPEEEEDVIESEQTFASLRVPELRDACRARGLRTQGLKAELLQRLQDAEAAARQAAEARNRGRQLQPHERHLLQAFEGAALLCDEGAAGRDPAAQVQDALILAEGWLNTQLRAFWDEKTDLTEDEETDLTDL